MKTQGQIFIFSILKTFTAIVFLIAAFLPHVLSAQLQEDFADNDFSENPAWQGSTTDFSVSDGVLQMKAATGVSAAYLATEIEILPNTTWEFWVRMAFNPSSSNLARIYLISDQPDLDSALNGYFVMIGNTNDDVSLYRQTGTLKTKLIDGIDGRLALDNVVIKIKVSCDQDGVWNLWSDVGLSGTFSLEGTTSESMKLESGYFGPLCIFTSTRADKFFFDDMNISSNQVTDSIPPDVALIEVKNSNQINIQFSESIVLNVAEAEKSFLVNNAIGYPQEATLSSDKKSVSLTFLSEFQPDKAYTLDILPIHDEAGNLSNTIQKEFVYSPHVVASWKDVIITEIFADPSPTVGLPAAEFVEIHNRADGSINLKNWILTDGTSEAQFPDMTIGKNDYLIVMSTNAQNLFDGLGSIAGLTSFPSLNNSGDNLIVRDQNGLSIDSLSYSLAWYHSSSKDDGGWSLEIIDVDNLCGEETNWTASEAEGGGTPGAINSVALEKPDLTGPVLLSAYLASTDTLVLSFNEKLSGTLFSLDDVRISPFLQMRSVTLEKSLRKLVLVPETPFSPKVLYAIEIHSLQDCPGNEIQSCCNHAEFAIPELADSLDVVINEVLFNPRTNGVDFVEIVNVSNKYIDLRNWMISNLSTGETGKLITGESILLRPNQYLALTTDPVILKNEYPRSNESTFLKSELPALNNEEGFPAIFNHLGKRIDSFQYTADMHSVFLENDEGVSLERISLNPSGDENWISASSTSGFATPGFKNSNMIPESAAGEQITLNPEIFIPVSGQPDFTKIEFLFPATGYMGTMRIYDSQGRIVKHIIENSLLGTEGFFVWEGDRDDGSKAGVGSYLVWVELYNSVGVVKRIHKRVVVASQF